MRNHSGRVSFGSGVWAVQPVRILIRDQTHATGVLSLYHHSKAPGKGDRTLKHEKGSDMKSGQKDVSVRRSNLYTDLREERAGFEEIKTTSVKEPRGSGGGGQTPGRCRSLEDTVGLKTDPNHGPRRCFQWGSILGGIVHFLGLLCRE